jgi:FMN reductase
MPTLIAILGSVTPPGRSSQALDYLLTVARETDPALTNIGLNLAHYRIAFADGRPPEAFADDTAKVVAQVQGADAVILLSPVYRASLSGSLKNLLDHLPLEALRDKPCGIVAIGATPHHYLGVDRHLRDILAWFGALTTPTSVYLTSSDFTNGLPTEAARHELAELACSVLRLRSAVAGISWGPMPLAGRR